MSKDLSINVKKGFPPLRSLVTCKVMMDWTQTQLPVYPITK